MALSNDPTSRLAFPRKVVKRPSGMSRITDSATELLEYKDVVAALRLPQVFSTRQEQHISGLIATARRSLEDWLRIAFIEQTWELVFDGVPRKMVLRLPRPPLLATNFVITSYAKDNTPTIMSASSYTLETEPRPPSQGRVFLNDGVIWPSDLRAHRALVISFECGYGALVGDVPRIIKTGVARLTADLYENPQNVVMTSEVSAEVNEIPPELRRVTSHLRVPLLGEVT